MALVGRDLAYEPAALSSFSFFLTWVSVALIRWISYGFTSKSNFPGVIEDSLKNIEKSGEEIMAFLELTGIQKKFGKQLVVHDFNLEVQKGEFVSFLGGSGCGKTTTLRMIAGFEMPTSGQSESTVGM